MTSKSWTVKSLKRPPEAAMYASCGGSGSCPARRTTYRRPELAALDQPPRLAVARVEAALEAELEANARRLDLLDQPARLGEIHRQRLLAEDRDAAREAGADEGRVRARARGDDERIGAGDRFLDARGRGPDVGRDRGRALGVRIGDDQGAGSSRPARIGACIAPIRPAPSCATRIRPPSPGPRRGGRIRARAGRSPRPPTGAATTSPARPSASPHSRCGPAREARRRGRARRCRAR